MSVLLFSKVVGLFGIAAAFTTYATYFINPSIFNYYEKIHVYAVSETTSDPAAADDIKHKVDEKNFQCQVTEKDQQVPFECEIVQFKEFEKKKILQSELKDTTNAEKDKLKVEKNFFKITISTEHGQGDTHHSLKIEVISKSTTTPPTTAKYATLKPMFAILGSHGYKTKAEYFLIKHTEAEEFTKGTSDYQCTGTDTGSTCKIHDFAESTTDNPTLADLTFKEPNGVASSMKSQHYYLIEFTEVDNISTKTIKIKNSGTTPNKELSFNAPIPAFYDSVKKQIFIFSDTNP